MRGFTLPAGQPLAVRGQADPPAAVGRLVLRYRGPDSGGELKDVAAVALDEDTPSSTVDHHLGDGRIAQQILDRTKERQDPVQAAHRAPRARWSK